VVGGFGAPVVHVRVDAVFVLELAQSVWLEDGIEQVVLVRVLGDGPYEQSPQAALDSVSATDTDPKAMGLKRRPHP
jgi:hypothetical protein